MKRNRHEELAALVRAEVLTSPMINSAREDRIRTLELRVKELEQALEQFMSRTRRSFERKEEQRRKLMRRFKSSRFPLTPRRNKVHR